MVKTGDNADKFLDDVAGKLRSLGLRNKENLLALKKAEHELTGQPFDGELYYWDTSYYKLQFVKKTLDLDSELIKEHFPVSVVVPSILSIYQKLLSVRFEEITDGSTWHPDVQKFAVWEKDPANDSGFLGYCYLDIYPRGVFISLYFKTSSSLIGPQRGSIRTQLCGHSFPDMTCPMANANTLWRSW